MRDYSTLARLTPEGALAEIVAHLDAGGDPRAHDNAALRWACSQGHLAMLERLIAGNTGTPWCPGLTADDARALDNEALRWACFKGHLDALERLIELGLTAADARARDNEALRLACSYGHLAVLERLIELGLTATDARARDNYALRRACERSHHAVAARLLELGVEPTPNALVLCGAGRQDDDEDWPQRLWRAVERWEGSPELQAAECGLTPPQRDTWEGAKDQARPSRLRFAD